MKKVLLAVAVSMVTAVSFYGQATATSEKAPAIPEKGTVVLQSRQAATKKQRDNYVDAAFSFEKATNGAAGVKDANNDWDVLFTTIKRNDGAIVRDIFTVTMVGDDRSRILDLGARGWKELRSVPELPAFDKPSREKDVDAIAGHIYLVHTADRNSDLYTLFRVEELKSGVSVKIDWRRIPPPQGPAAN